VLKSEIHQLENERTDLEQDLELKKQREKDRILPEIEKINRLITDMDAEIAQNEQRVATQEKSNSDLEAMLKKQESKKEERNGYTC